MSRQPIQVLVIPFRKLENYHEFAIFRRADANYWQFIAGGVEGAESNEAAARREAFEEAGIPLGSKIIVLNSRSAIPANVFQDWESWPANIDVVPEFSFAVEVSNKKMQLSKEHQEFKWCNYNEAQNLLKWDSNKTALWELSQRLRHERAIP